MTVMSETVARPFELPAAVRSQVTVPLRFTDGFAATAEIMTFHGLADGKEHLLLAIGAWEQTLLDQGPEGTAPLVRLHSECLTGDVFGSERCDCGPQLREAVEEIAAVGGFLLYLRQEGRGIGLYSKLDAYALQDTGLDTYEANVALGRGEDERDYSSAAQMLGALGAGRIRLLTNNPDKVAQLTALGVDVAEQVPTGVHLSAANHRYLAAKRSHTAHTIELPTEVPPAEVQTAGFMPAEIIPTHDELLARVDALIPRLRERAAETEEIRRVPEATMAELKAAGVIQMLAPKAVGGFGMGLETYVEVVRRLAQGCVSTAWTAGHLVEHVWMLARWPQEAQDEVFASGPAPLAAATGAPPGRADKVPGGVTISGRWSFASGVMHSEWALLAVQHADVRLQCLVPVSDLELLDVWHTAGLRGTGSNDLAAENLFVPAHRALEWNLLAAADNPGSRIHPDPNIHIPMATFLNMVAPASALGAAEHALGVFQDLMMVRKVKQTTQARQADSPLAQARFSQAYGQVATARLHWQEAVRVVADSYGRRPVSFTDDERARYRLSLGLSGAASAEAVRLILTGSGGSVHRLTHPLQRIQRDVNVLLNHASLTMDPILEQAGRGLLDLGFSIPAEQF
ncbi:GTP cyclohydrolase II RibA [Pseudarthrobacter sp. NBSH8]|uniref:GTP cyclohydrolase II RibA n=1 Tax=Pseudarthrobacter sp. NBSH8 TaxID=2596911 RepID=UPI00162764A3|nr:GTP cyclohydrolase II RibA [Pseudarthrobacter sp. NBSH8]QNE14836.1 GTP cyclohydrolase II RibA [Pseudarthrobacter sp. NBSH8]